MLGANNLVKNSDKEKWVYSGYGITFDAAGSWHFGNYLFRNVVIFVVGNIHLLMLAIARIIF